MKYTECAYQKAMRIYADYNQHDHTDASILLGHNKAGDFYLTDTLFNGEEGILPLDADSQRYQPKRPL